MIAFAKDRFGENPLFPGNHFELTDAVSLDSSRDTLRSGYKLGVREAIESDLDAPYPLIVAQSKERIMPTLYRLIEVAHQESSEVQFFVDSFTREDHNARTSLWTPEVSLVQVKKMLKQFEDLILNEGLHAYALRTPSGELEIQLDDHKLILIYAESDALVAKLACLLEDMGLTNDPILPLIIEKDHTHHSLIHHQTAMDQLIRALELSPAEEGDNPDF